MCQDMVSHISYLCISPSLPLAAKGKWSKQKGTQWSIIQDFYCMVCIEFQFMPDFCAFQCFITIRALVYFQSVP